MAATVAIKTVEGFSAQAPVSPTRENPRARAAPKRYDRGTHRTASPTETLARIRPHLVRFGITRLADVSGLDRLGIPVAVAHRPNSRSVSVSVGSGLDLQAAKVSASMEAVQLWHAENPKLPLLLGSILEIARTRRVADVAGLPRASGPVDPHQQLLWTEGRDLTSGENVCVPYELVHMSYAVPLLPSSGSWLRSASGLASGNHPLEALAHALSDLIERDALALFHSREASSRERLRIDLDTIDDDDGCRILRKLADAGVEVAIWDATSDVGVPVFACELVERDLGHGRPFLPGRGAGCHPCRAIALQRALTAAAEMRLTTVAGVHDDPRLVRSRRSLESGSWRSALARVLGMGERSFASVPNTQHDSFDDDVPWLLARLASVGLEQVLAVDLTQTELELAVVRVIVPGLEALHDGVPALPGRRLASMTERSP